MHTDRDYINGAEKTTAFVPKPSKRNRWPWDEMVPGETRKFPYAGAMERTVLIERISGACSRQNKFFERTNKKFRCITDQAGWVGLYCCINPKLMI